MKYQKFILAAFTKNFPIMGITWATGLRFRPVTSQFDVWNKEHVVVNCRLRFMEL